MEKNTYIIPSPQGELIYAPLSRFLCKLSDFDSSLGIPPAIYDMSDCMAHSQRWGHIVVIPTQICNLNCSYCYARQAHSKKTIDKSKLQVAYDFFLSQDQVTHKTVSFLGGGEPLVAWDVVEWSITYLEKNKRRNDIISYAITTNATLLDATKIEFFKKYNVYLEISFDILRDIQDNQRPFLHSSSSSFDRVIKSLSLMDDSDLQYTVRSTITPQVVKRMPEMVKSLSKYRGVTAIKLEPVTAYENIDADFYDAYTNSFWEARRIGKLLSMTVTNSIVSSAANIKDIFCIGDFCVTADGEISACHRNTSLKDSHFDLCHIGSVTEHVEISQDKLDHFIEVSKCFEHCENCYGRWHCAGFCMMEWVNLSKKEINAKCDFIRENIRRRLIEIYDSMAESEKPQKSRNN